MKRGLKRCTNDQYYVSYQCRTTMSRLKIKGILETKQNKIIAIFLVSTFLFSIAYIGIGYTVASQGISANPGCGMWASNTPDNWTTNDDWESFEPWNDSEERIDIRKNFDVSNYQRE